MPSSFFVNNGGSTAARTTITDDLTASAAAKSDAQKLALNAEDAQFTLSDGVTTGNSALHYNAKANASATAAAGSASTATQQAVLANDAKLDAQTAKAEAVIAFGDSVQLTGDQTIAGAKSFTSGIAADYIDLTGGESTTTTGTIACKQIVLDDLSTTQNDASTIFTEASGTTSSLVISQADDTYDKIKLRVGSASTLVDALTASTDGIAVTGSVTSSDGIYLGGTAAANKLDDYEEGIHNTTIAATSGTPTIASSENSLSYVKIGSIVHINGQLGTTNCGGCSGELFVTMPFTSASLAERADFYFINVVKGDAGASVLRFYLLNTAGGTASFKVVATKTNGSEDSNVASLMANEGNFDLNISGSYRTSQ